MTCIILGAGRYDLTKVTIGQGTRYEYNSYNVALAHCCSFLINGQTVESTNLITRMKSLLRTLRVCPCVTKWVQCVVMLFKLFENVLP